ncbi:hypothetical protein [Halorubrum aidingense]|uniref:hypothetical protein n=1 Tax=Halorubrum aidingense TaxID=368623 RepID=UPI0012673589|nr:hypothetical protein [Halorubrum aidingense]
MSTAEKELNVLEYYLDEVENDHYRSLKNEQFEELEEDDDAVEAAEVKFENRRDESQHSKKVRTTLMAAFLRNGPLERVTNWEFKRLFPLRTLDIDSADVLIGNQTDGAILLIIILPLRQTPDTGVSKAAEMMQGIRDNNSTLSDDIGLDFHNDRIQTAVAIEPERSSDTATAIEDYEDSLHSPERFYVWQVAGPQGEKIKVYTDFPDNSGADRNHEGQLGNELSKGAEIIDSPHVLPDFFYDTHHSLLLEHTIPKMASNRVDTDIPNTHFSKQELLDYYRDTLHGPDSAHKASQLSGRVIRLWKYLDLLAEVSSGDDQIEDGSTVYRFKSRKRNPDSIYDDLSEEYEDQSITFLLEVDAMEDVIEQYQDDSGVQADLGEFLG